MTLIKIYNMDIKFNTIILMGFLAFFATNSCSLVGDEGDATEIVNMRINHFQQTAFGSFPQLVLLVQEENEIGGEDWTNFYDQIEGFNYEPGFVYDVTVKKEQVENLPQDASSVKYILQSMMSKEKVAENVTFNIRLKWGGDIFVKSSGDSYSLMDEYMIFCSETCEDLSRDLENKEEVTGTFTHGDNNGLKLISVQ